MTAQTRPRDWPSERVDEQIIQTALVVDDSRMQRRILTASLKRWGYQVQEADSGEEALEICRKNPPDLVLSDWVMPGLSGVEFCKAFREVSGDHYAYFILLTSKTSKEEVARGLNGGADDFLSKPVDPNELRARINAGQRILAMQRELRAKHQLMTDTLGELRRVYDSLDSDLIEAKKLQQSLLPQKQLVWDNGRLSLLLRSSGHVGGDLVGFFPAGDGFMGLFGLDVSGHGISSALMTARLAGYLSATALDQNVALEQDAMGTHLARPPDEAIAALNALVLGEMETEHYFTLMLCVVEMATGRVEISQAGHPHPLVQRANGQIEQTGEGGFPVGLVEGISYSRYEVQLNPGDRLLILSDGVTECPGPDGTMLGEEGLETFINDLRNINGPALLEGLVDRLVTFAAGEDFPDDISAVLYEYCPDR
ncbi:MAG: PP2C family protein-serine/threonine phosphatase [Sulfitobacter sp.]